MTGAQPARDVLDRAPDEIAARASEAGQVRLDRTNLDILLTGVIGGIEVSLGGFAAMLVVGAVLTAWPGLRPTSPTASSALRFFSWAMQRPATRFSTSCSGS